MRVWRFSAIQARVGCVMCGGGAGVLLVGANIRVSSRIVKVAWSCTQGDVGGFDVSAVGAGVVSVVSRH
jgi:hypothetical protein